MKVTQTMEIWKQVGEKEQVVGEYTYGSYISPEFAFLWNKDIDNRKAMRVLKMLVEIKAKIKTPKKTSKKK